jgi:hypothetical protein
MKSIIIRWAEHVARVVEKRGAYGVLVGRPDGTSHLADEGVNWRLILKCIFMK